MGVVRGAADLVGQQSQHAIDSQHALVMALVGIGMSGCGGALWLRHLERTLGPSDGPKSVLTKSCADLLCWGPIVNSANLVLVPLLLVRCRNDTSFLPHSTALALLSHQAFTGD